MKNSTNSQGAFQANANSAQQFSPSTSSQSALEKLSDKELYGKCKYYGEMARTWRQKFIGLLPEVNRRRLYEKKEFSSIFEFAAKLCGLSKDQVYLALNLEKRFEDKPVLKKMLENGEASINKLARVVSIATPENEEELAEKVKILPSRALETFVRDEKYAQNSGAVQQDVENQNGSFKPFFDGESLHVHASFSTNRQTAIAETLNFEIADDIKQQLNELNAKGIDINELLRELLKQRREKIAEVKEKLAQSAQQTKSHYISTETQKILKEEFGEKCSITTCQKPAQIIHHTQRFSLSQNHDPKFLAPLCKEHHIIAHSMDAKYHRTRECLTPP